MSRYRSKFCYLKGGSVTLNANLRGKGASPTNDFWHQKTRLPELSYGEKIAENFNRLSRAHQRYRRQTTDGIAIACSERNVVTFAKKRGNLIILVSAGLRISATLVYCVVRLCTRIDNAFAMTKNCVSVCHL